MDEVGNGFLGNRNQRCASTEWSWECSESRWAEVSLEWPAEKPGVYSESVRSHRSQRAEEEGDVTYILTGSPGCQVEKLTGLRVKVGRAISSCCNTAGQVRRAGDCR